MIIEMSGDRFAKNLVYLRTKYKLPRRALANLVGLSDYHLEMIEKGLARPAVEMEVLRRICQVFNVDSNDLVHLDLWTHQLPLR